MAEPASRAAPARPVSTLAIVAACALLGFWLVFPFAWAVAEKQWEVSQTQWLLGGLVGAVHAAVIVAGRRRGQPWDLVALGLVGGSVGALSAIVPIVEDDGGDLAWLAVGLLTLAAGLLLLHLVPAGAPRRTAGSGKSPKKALGPE